MQPAPSIWIPHRVAFDLCNISLWYLATQQMHVMNFISHSIFSPCQCFQKHGYQTIQTALIWMLYRIKLHVPALIAPVGYKMKII